MVPIRERRRSLTLVQWHFISSKFKYVCNNTIQYNILLHDQNTNVQVWQGSHELAVIIVRCTLWLLHVGSDSETLVYVFTYGYY